MALIEHNHLRPWAALVGGHRAVLHPTLDALAPEHPDKRWVLAKSVWAMRCEDREQDLSEWGAYYHDQDAEAYARRALMPAIEFRAGAHLPDGQLAACLRVPAEKIADRRAELTAEQDRPRPGRLCAELDPGPERHVAQPSNGRKHRQRTRRAARR
jgi:hypothetical protein